MNDPAILAFVVFGGIPLALVAYTVWLLFMTRDKQPDVYPLGDATETPRTIINVRRANWEAKQ